MSAAIKAKHQRLILVAIALVALIGAGLLATWALRNQASFFYLPAEMANHPPVVGRAVRLGGIVEAGSLKPQADGVTIDFIVSDGKAKIPVRFKGIAPDLFKEGSGVVAEGQLDPDGRFVADNLLARHDEKYVPREMKDMTAAEARQTVELTK